MRNSVAEVSFSEDFVRDAFLAILPRVSRRLRSLLRSLRGELREEALQEGLANAFVAFWRLCRRGCWERVFPGALARFAAAQWRVGRRVGCSSNSRDVLSPIAARLREVVVESLDRRHEDSAIWQEAVWADSQTPIPDQVWFRIDFPEWLARLSPRDRQVAERLAQGESTSDVARDLALSAGRVSQLRRELCDSWHRFHGDDSESVGVIAG